MKWIKRLLGEASAEPSTEDIERICNALRGKWDEMGDARHSFEEKNMGVPVSAPLRDALIFSPKFHRVCDDYAERGWKLVFMDTLDPARFDTVVMYQRQYPREDVLLQ
jgi:hypothetical protein